MKIKLSHYLPGVLLFMIAVVIGLSIYQDYGMSWDEPFQRHLGQMSWEYVFNGSHELLTAPDRNYGSGFELVLMFFEKRLKLSDTRDIYLMRHLVNHLLFLVSCFSVYVLGLRLFKNRFLACLGMLLLLTAPRIYAHSFFNSKDIPALSLFIIAITAAQAAFEKRSAFLFFIVGLLCGYTTSIRIVGITLGLIILLFQVIDLVLAAKRKEGTGKRVLSFFLFVFGFCLSLVAFWPYLWQAPIARFAESYRVMTHYGWAGKVLFNGTFVSAASLPWNYVPVWFGITLPVVWLAAGIGGIIWLIVNALKQPAYFLQNNNDRFLILLLISFAGPITAVILFHSVVYDDWRHLYFVYPSFVLLGVYCINKLWQTKIKTIVAGLCLLQVGGVVYFMVKNHPFQQVYFNELVSHDKEYLQDNYEMDYWGCAFKQGLEHVLATDKRNTIKMAWAVNPLPNNIMMLPAKDRARIQMIDGKADYLITNFRDMAHGKYTELTPYYTISVLNSKIMCIYKLQ